VKVSSKTIIVTGGGSGIGRELVLNLLSRGASVAAIDLNADALAETKILSADSPRLSTHTINITDKAAVEELPAKVIAIHGHVDGLINNAGIIQPFKRINDLDYASIERVINVNFWGLLYMTKTFLPHFLDRPEGHIVNVSSMGAYAPVPGQSVYGASKAAVKLMTEGLYAELLDSNVRVTVVFPGATATNISTNSGVTFEGQSTDASESKFKTLPASEAARLIIDGMESDAYHVFTGSDAKMMDRIARYAPNRVAKIIYKRMKSLLP
jgi:short-subunit dehydrogenase